MDLALVFVSWHIWKVFCVSGGPTQSTSEEQKARRSCWGTHVRPDIKLRHGILLSEVRCLG